MRARPRRRRLVAVFVCAALAIGVATVGAGNIAGTAGGDKLRGTAGADRLNGRAGNDKLYGLAGNDVLIGGPGNDLLVGGPGADRLLCGPGRDIASGDAKDKAAKDCEVVKGIRPVSPPPPPPSPPPPPPAPPPPPPPPAPKAQSGNYCGNTVQGPPLCIQTNGDATALAKIETSSLVDCTEPVQLRFEFAIGFQGALPIQSDLSFSLDYSGPLSSGSSQITNMQTTYFIRGKFTTDGKATGQLAVTSLSFDYAGYHFACTQNPVDWSVTKQG